MLKTENLLSRITVNPKIMVGKPTIRGMRITVEQLLRALGKGVSVHDLLEEYPEIEKEDLQAVLEYYPISFPISNACPINAPIP